MYSTYNKGKSLVAERFARTLKNKMFKHMTAISKNVYFDVLDDIVNKYNNIVHRTIKMKPIDFTGDSSTECNEYSNKNDPIFKVGDHARISKCKKVFAKGYAPNWPEESTKLVKNINGYLVRLYRIKMSQYFPKPFISHFGDSMKVKIDLSNYATKTDIKNISHVNTSSLALTINLANLKTEVNKLDIYKLAPIPADLSKLSNLVKNDVAKKTVYDKLDAKVNNIDTSDFVSKTK